MRSVFWRVCHCQYPFMFSLSEQLMTMLERQFLTGIHVRNHVASPFSTSLPIHNSVELLSRRVLIRHVRPDGERVLPCATPMLITGSSSGPCPCHPQRSQERGRRPAPGSHRRLVLASFDGHLFGLPSPHPNPSPPPCPASRHP